MKDSIRFSAAATAANGPSSNARLVHFEGAAPIHTFVDPAVRDGPALRTMELYVRL